MLIVQVMLIREGTLMEGARWEVSSLLNVREGHTFQVCLPIEDQRLMKYVARQAKTECSLDKAGNAYSIIFKCVVKEVRHFLDTTNKAVESMAIVSAANMYVEGIMTYMISPDKCNPKFVQQINGPA